METKAVTKRHEQKQLDFTKYKRVKLALKFSYLGKNYQGLAAQRNTENTVEHHLFYALRRTCLIAGDSNIKESGYSRCGRTDKGVSALGNVFSLFVRESKGKDYCQKLNHALPEDIRIIAYSEVPEHFDSRFSCIYREYKYFFAQGTMDINRIMSACKKLLGLHDFRNFCKKDESFKFEEDEGDEDSANYLRRVFNYSVEPIHINQEDEK